MHYNHLQQSKNKAVASLAKTISKELQNRFQYVLDPKSQQFNAAYCIATLLDPSLALCLDDSQTGAAKDAIVNMV